MKEPDDLRLSLHSFRPEEGRKEGRKERRKGRRMERKLRGNEEGRNIT